MHDVLQNVLLGSRSHGVCEAQAGLGRLRAFGNPINDLLFHHAILQLRHHIGIITVKFNDLRRIFVGGGNKLHGFLEACRIELQVILTRNFTNQQSSSHAIMST